MKLQNYVQMKMNEIKVQQAEQAIKITEIQNELLLIQKELSLYESPVPKPIIKTNALVKVLNFKNKNVKKNVKNEKNLFTKYSITIFRDILKFFTFYEIKTLRLVCKATNQLCEQSLDVLIKLREQRKKKIFAAAETTFQQPQYVNLSVVRQFLNKNRKQILEKNNNQYSKALEYITLINEMVFSYNTKNVNTLVNLTSVIQRNVNLLDWYNLSDYQIRKLKQLISQNFLQYDFSEIRQIQVLQKFIRNLHQFVFQYDYRLMQEVHTLDKSIRKLNNQQTQLNKLSFQYDKKRNKLPKIQLLDNIFFENVLLFCEYEDWKTIRFVCKFFNFKFRQNIIKLCWIRILMNNKALDQLFQISDGYKISHLGKEDIEIYQKYQQFKNELETKRNNLQSINKQEEPQQINLYYEVYLKFEKVDCILRHQEILNFYKNFGL